MNKADVIGEEMHELQAAAPDTQVAPAHGIAAIALSMALKYHGMMMIPDGLTYQQYKMEGRNIREIGLNDVLETAIKIELHLLASSDRIAKVVMDALVIETEDQDDPDIEPKDPS